MSYHCDCGTKHTTLYEFISCRGGWHEPMDNPAGIPKTIQLAIPIDAKLQAKIARHNELMEKPMTATSAEDFAELTGLFHSIALTLYHTTMAELHGHRIQGPADAGGG